MLVCFLNNKHDFPLLLLTCFSLLYVMPVCNNLWLMGMHAHILTAHLAFNLPCVGAACGAYYDILISPLVSDSGH